MRRILTDGGAYAVHRGIATAEHHHAFAFHADIGLIGGFTKAHDLLSVSDQERQRVVNTRSVFVVQSTAHRLIGPDAEEHRIVLLQQVVELHVAAHFGIEFELNAHAGEDLPAAGHHLFFQLERRDTEGQQAADFRMAVKYHRLDAVTGQHVGAGEARRASADDRDGFTGRLHVGEIRTPAHLECLIVDIAFDVADGHRAELIVQRTGAFTQAVLRADAPADFRQSVGLMRQLGRFKNTPLVGQLQPVRDVVMHRALPFAVRVATGEAAIRLRLGLAF